MQNMNRFLKKVTERLDLEYKKSKIILIEHELIHLRLLN